MNTKTHTRAGSSPPPRALSVRARIPTTSDPKVREPPEMIVRYCRRKRRQYSIFGKVLEMVLIVTLHVKAGAEGAGRSTQGPTFSQEPPHHLDFTNTSGASVNCVAEGVPEPTVSWTYQDGRPLDQ
ncbi:uncharacterized protein LOC121875439, partial [Homarus americanus]